MKRHLFVLTLMLSLGMFFSAKAQNSINLNGAKSAQQCENVTENGFTATFSFGSIEARAVNTEKGVFSEIAMSNTFNCGNAGEPSLPAAHQLVAVPFGAKDVSVEVKNYSTMVYNLSDYGINAITPQQPSVRKDQTEVAFHYNAEAYARRGFAERPLAEIELQGTMRGIQVGSLVINPVQYDAASNSLKVFNDIEVEVSYGEYDKAAAYDEFARTASVYFAPLYRQMFNWRNDVYAQHPDLWQAPVKMLVITDRMFENAIQEWVDWKTKKGFYMDVNYTDQIGTSASAIKSFIQTKYAQTAPTFVIIIGDKNQVPASATGSATQCVTDLYYQTVDNDYYPEMLHSRMPVETVEQLNNLLEKSLQYEQYTMPDPSYLNNVLLIAGWDEAWNPKAGVPTIQYAVNNYYNEEHGFENVYDYYTLNGYTGCYDNLNTGVGFVNYTAHGSNVHWENPQFEVDDVNNLTNTNKYFLAMGNCCLAADWGISGTCFGEAMVRAPRKGAFAYIGSCPSTYWYEDYYFGVGATNVFYRMPSRSETTTGVYDGVWMDDSYNTIQSMVFLGNLSVTYAHVNSGYTVSSDSSPLYYWQCYHTLGDGSIMPYHVQPAENHVFHAAIVPIGANTYEVSADPGSYVALTRNGVILGTGLVDETGTVVFSIDPVTTSGDVTLCVTHPQRVPYLEEIPAANINGAFIIVDSYTPSDAHIGAENALAITFKNAGTASTDGTTSVSLTCDDPNVTIINGSGSFNALAQNATVEVSGFSYSINENVADGSRFHIMATATCGSETWEGVVNIVANKAIMEFAGAQCPSGFSAGETLQVAASFENVGHYVATNANITISSTNQYVTFGEESVAVGSIAPGGIATVAFDVTIASGCPESEQIPLTFNIMADDNVVAGGTATLQNTCLVVFDLSDKWNDGWDDSRLHVEYSDGTPADDMYVSREQGAFATYERWLHNGSHVTLTWHSGGNWDSECSYVVHYEDGTVILSNGPQGGSFDVSCGSGEYFAPVWDLSATVNGNNVALSWAAPSGANRYRIARNGVTLGETTATSYNDQVQDEMTYTYSVTAIYSGGESMPVNVLVDVITAVDENEIRFSVYPNPADDVVYINVGDVEYDYFIYNNLGQQVIGGAADGSQRVDVSGLSEGLYVVKICESGTVTARRIVVR